MSYLPQGIPAPVFGPGSGPETGPETRAGAFSIGSIRGESYLRPLAENYFQRCKKQHVSVYPCGVEFHTGKAPKNGPDRDTIRGKITEMSDKARRRLFEQYVTHEVPGTRELSVTLTTRENMTKERFSAAKDRFRKRTGDAGCAAIWVPEIQRRGAPHAHLFFYAPPDVTEEKLREWWLHASRQQRDPDARKFAFHSRPVDDKNSGWAIYMAKHIGKESLQKEGWEGKSWGVWNSSAFVKRQAVEFEMTNEQAAKVRRTLLRHQNSIRRRDLARARALASRASLPVFRTSEGEALSVQMLTNGSRLLVDSEGATVGVLSSHVPHVVSEFARLRKILRPLRKLHGGDLFRLVPGEVMERICRWAIA